jgi:hypothetical protein
MSNPHTNGRKLDAELSRRLDATLDASTKFELEAMRVLDTLATAEEGSLRSPPDATTTSREGQEYPTSPAGETPAGATAEVLARVVFKDGDAFHDLAIPADGEIGLAYIGSNRRRWLAATSELPSPLRMRRCLGCSPRSTSRRIGWPLWASDACVTGSTNLSRRRAVRTVRCSCAFPPFRVAFGFRTITP